MSPTPKIIESKSLHQRESLSLPGEIMVSTMASLESPGELQSIKMVMFMFVTPEIGVFKNLHQRENS